ncbi:hypothetical protein FRC02_004118 [Tulasnella sp. 418]|nr:hypothetical protein FRC02_004118 [Tulasnella sp. 418]
MPPGHKTPSVFEEWAQDLNSSVYGWLTKQTKEETLESLGVNLVKQSLQLNTRPKRDRPIKNLKPSRGFAPRGRGRFNNLGSHMMQQNGLPFWNNNQMMWNNGQGIWNGYGSPGPSQFDTQSHRARATPQPESGEEDGFSDPDEYPSVKRQKMTVNSLSTRAAQLTIGEQEQAQPTATAGGVNDQSMS